MSNSVVKPTINKDGKKEYNLTINVFNALQMWYDDELSVLKKRVEREESEDLLMDLALIQYLP